MYFMHCKEFSMIFRESLCKWVAQHGTIQKNVALKTNTDEKGFQKRSFFSASICYHCSKWVLFIYTLNNVQLKSFVYECHTCITIIHCETVMGKMVFKANLHIHKSKISCMETKLSLLFFLLKMKKKEVRIHRRSCSQKSGKSALRGSVMLMIMKRHKEYLYLL